MHDGSAGSRARLVQRRLSRRRLLTAATTAGLGAAGLALVGCGDDDSPSSTEPAVPVSLALDWVPNTNHTGFFVADEMGWYGEEGVQLELLPYAQVEPDTLVATGEADFGISFAPSLTLAVAAGRPLTSVMAILQRPASALAVRSDRSDIQTPADLDGLVYAGFGAPWEEVLVRTVIRNAGGRGEFETVVLSTFAYEAVYAGEADFVVPFMTWGGIEAELRGTPLKAFQYRDYGFPDFYAVLLMSNPEWLSANEEAARGFVRATQRGFQFAAENPDEAAQILIDTNPGVFPEEELVVRSARLLGSDYYLDERGAFGTQTLDRWTEFPRFLFENGLLMDADGNPLTAELDYEALFTDEYLA